MLLDTLGAELFLGQGQALMSIGFLTDYNCDRLTMVSDGGQWEAELLCCALGDAMPR